LTINVWGYLKEYNAERSEILEAVDQVFSSGRLVLGESLAGFEKEFARFCGVGHCVGVSNGTDALTLGLKALGIKPGDEVITVSNTAAPTVVAIVAAGATPRFVDIDADTYLMDVTQLVGVLTPRTACVLPVHLYGQCADMCAVQSFAGQHGLKVLEDCAQAHGASHGGRLAGSMSDAAAFSFYPTKILGAFGDAGAVVTDSDEVAQSVRRLRFYGMAERYYVVDPRGTNSRLDEVQAEILRRKLARVGSYIARRRQIAARYDELLADTGLTPPRSAPGNVHAYYAYVVRHPRRDVIIGRMRERGVVLSILYAWPVHTMSAFGYLGCRTGELPKTEAAANEIFSLPMYPSLTDAEQDKVCDALRDVLASL
jgi:dTDP-3-amino-2,3,6-trideoxy-4-keto-D-glucose/dTDP-3-amino-3,4,6-trideoxy-alpha-D-glucose/dTDP-2,6-dideoxy-D-kanosamine transaminase